MWLFKRLARNDFPPGSFLKIATVGLSADGGLPLTHCRMMTRDHSNTRSRVLWGFAVRLDHDGKGDKQSRIVDCKVVKESDGDGDHKGRLVEDKGKRKFDSMQVHLVDRTVNGISCPAHADTPLADSRKL